MLVEDERVGIVVDHYDVMAAGKVDQRFITYTAVTDERICDGFYFSTAFKTIKSIMRNPYQLDEPPKEIFYDID